MSHKLQYENVRPGDNEGPAFEPMRRESPSLDIPDAVRDASIQRSGYAMGFRVISPELTKAWGPFDVATTRALLQTETTHDNETLIRTYHPAFQYARGHRDVAIHYARDAAMSWVIFDLNINIPCRDAGGLVIHYLPVWQRDDWLLQNDPLPPAPQEMYPGACGLRLWATGLIQILYPTAAALENDRFAGAPRTIGTVVVEFHVMDCSPSPAGRGDVNMTGRKVTSSAGNNDATASLGLRILLLDGTPALTTVTHGFCKLPQTRTLTDRISRALGFISVIRDSIWRYRSPMQVKMDLPFVTGDSPPTSNSALGKRVWLLGRTTPLGQITQTFDNPSHTRPYPCGFSHDLSLITHADMDNQFEKFPRLDSGYSLPVVDGWADVGEILGGAPLFVPWIVAHTTQMEKQLGTAIGKEEQRHIQSQIQLAVSEGVQYSWGPEKMSESVALLWRTCSDPNDKDNKGLSARALAAQDRMLPHSLVGVSGSLICQGRPQDKTCKAAVFQNFEVSGTGTWAAELLCNVKAGFLLPRFITEECKIDHGTIGVDLNESRYATMPRAERSSSPKRRTVTNPV